MMRNERSMDISRRQSGGFGYLTRNERNSWDDVFIFLRLIGGFISFRLEAKKIRMILPVLSLNRYALSSTIRIRNSFLCHSTEPIAPSHLNLDWPLTIEFSRMAHSWKWTPSFFRLRETCLIRSTRHQRQVSYRKFDRNKYYYNLCVVAVLHIELATKWTENQIERSLFSFGHFNSNDGGCQSQFLFFLFLLFFPFFILPPYNFLLWKRNSNSIHFELRVLF